MARNCGRCGTGIDPEATRYAEHADGTTTTYCSVNCIADVDHVDEERAQQRLFTDPLEA